MKANKSARQWWLCGCLVWVMAAGCSSYLPIPNFFASIEFRGIQTPNDVPADSEANITIRCISRDDQGVVLTGIGIIFSDSPHIGWFDPDTSHSDSTIYHVIMARDTIAVKITAHSGYVQESIILSLHGT